MISFQKKTLKQISNKYFIYAYLYLINRHLDCLTHAAFRSLPVTCSRNCTVVNTITVIRVPAIHVVNAL